MPNVVGTARALSLMGLEASGVLVEAALLGGLPHFSLVGLADTAVSEARERLRASFARIGVQWPNERLTVNLSPADTAKSGTGFDLAIAVAIFGALGYKRLPKRTIFIGELGLDASVRAVRGVVPYALAAVRLGYERIVVPAENEAEARLVSGLTVVPVGHLAQVAAFMGVPGIEYQENVGRSNASAHSERVSDTCESGGHNYGRDSLDSQKSYSLGGGEDTYPSEFADVYGQEEAIWALQVAAVGGHHVQLVGAPGIGKSMLAQRFPAILPYLSEKESVEVAAIQSLAGAHITSLPRRRPFSAPHHTSTTPALVGGGNGIPQPGAITFAHRGVLFCDEFPEFSSKAIQALREPMETGWVDIHRAQAHIRYPAKFQLIAAANPCRCGHALDGPGACVCKPHERLTYKSNMGGPIRDRFDIRLIVRRPSKAALALGGQISTAQARKSVLQARELSEYRICQSIKAQEISPSVRCNADAPGAWLREHTNLSEAMEGVIDRQLSRGLMSLRGLDRILRVAWSIADMGGHESPLDDDIAMACTLRGSEDIYGG